MGCKPLGSEYIVHQEGTGPVDEAQELTWEDFVKLTTVQSNLCVPRTVRRRDAALFLEQITLPPMLLEVIS